MTIQAFIENAVQGGIPRDAVDGVNVYELLLNPELWKAVGKVEGWNVHDNSRNLYEAKPHWLYLQHRMIDALAEGKTLEQYLETL